MYFIPGKDYEIFFLDQPVRASYFYETPVMDDEPEMFDPEKEFPEHVNFKIVKDCFRLYSGEIIPAKDIYLYKSLESGKWCPNPEVTIFFNNYGFLSLSKNKYTVFEYKKRSHHFIRFQIEIINNIELEYSVDWNDKLSGIQRKHSIKKSVVDIYDEKKTLDTKIFIEVGKELANIMDKEGILYKAFVMNEIICAL